MFVSSTDSLMIADSGADPEFVAWDLAGQAEYGHNSPVWLVTDDRASAERAMARVPELITDLPQINACNAEAAWRNYAEAILCENRNGNVAIPDGIAPECLHVQAADPDWWLGRLTSYGLLFLGGETTVASGNKASGADHVLPTSGAARYTAGLSVHKYMKLVTWQRVSREGDRPLAKATTRISRLQGMEGHARTTDIRLATYFPGRTCDLGMSAPRPMP